MSKAAPTVDRPGFWKDLNSFLFSAVCHLTVLLLLALFTVAANRNWHGIELLANLSPGYDGPTGDDLDAEDAVQFEVTPAESSAAGPVQAIEFSDVAASNLADLDPLANIANLASGLDGRGVGTLGDAVGGPPSYATQFFGIGGSGHSFVYVVDCSNSMREEGKFERARYELLSSIEHLTPEQSFFVIFYNDGSYPMDADEPVPATADQVDRLRRWVSYIEPGGGTNPLPALLMALRLKPDAIFFLSDGLFDPGAIQAVRSANRSRSGRIPIHTISFVNYESQGLMRTIARNAGGEFRFVP
jgi:von Willebrand factor type A domain